MMKTGTNNRKAAVTLLLASVLFALAGAIIHGCGVTEYGEITLKRIVITPADKSVYSGATVAFKAEGIYSDTTKKDLTTKVTWQSSGSEVTIDAATGLATAGTVSSDYSCTITATHADGIKGTTLLTVKLPSFESISIAAPNTTLAMGTSVQFAATGSLDDNSTQDVTSKVTWNSSDPATVEIDATGKATGKAGGSADITATYSGKTSNAVTITVSSVSLASLTIQVAGGGSAAINQTETVQFAATGTFSDSSTQDMTGSVTWNSSDETVATISAAGLATAQAKDGTTSITATFGATTSNSETLTVSGPALQSIAIITGGDGITTIPHGSTKLVTASATYSDGTIGDVTMDVEWSSSNPAVGEVVKTASTVGIKGVNSGTSNLTVTITISLEGKTASQEYTVLPGGGN